MTWDPHKYKLCCQKCIDGIDKELMVERSRSWELTKELNHQLYLRNPSFNQWRKDKP